MKITIVYDNEAAPPFKSDWGFSCLIETKEANVLFDTGAKGEILLRNMSELELDPKDITAVVLSHDHWDHTGGLEWLLSVNSNIIVYKPTFSNTPKKIFPTIMTTGTLGGRYSIQEQALVCTTGSGLVVITGCSHPGLENILNTAKRFGKVYAVLGGFHGFDKFDAIKGISIIVPCHCTSHKREIQALFPDAYKEGGVGKKFEL